MILIDVTMVWETSFKRKCDDHNDSSGQFA